jgi:hypothetical protein
VQLLSDLNAALEFPRDYSGRCLGAPERLEHPVIIHHSVENHMRSGSQGSPATNSSNTAQPRAPRPHSMLTKSRDIYFS